MEEANRILKEKYDSMVFEESEAETEQQKQALASYQDAMDAALEQVYQNQALETPEELTEQFNNIMSQYDFLTEDERKRIIRKARNSTRVEESGFLITAGDISADPGVLDQKLNRSTITCLLSSSKDKLYAGYDAET